jgi:hypothetical protein
VSYGGDEAPRWSLQAGIEPLAWPNTARDATTGLRQGTLVVSPPFTYAASAAHPIHAITRAWAESPSAQSGVVNVVSLERLPPYGLIVTQTCDLVEEGKPKRPWIQIAPVYLLVANRGDRTRIVQGRGFDYLVPVTALAPHDGALWVADLRLLVVAEKGWLVGRETLAAFVDEAGYDRLAQQLGHLFARTAYATVVVERVLRPTRKLFSDIIERYEGQDPIVEVGLALGRSRLEPVNAQLVFMLDGELSPGLRAQIVDWWQPLSEAARAEGLELLAPRFVSLDQLTAREYRALDVLDASSLSPEPEQPPDAS